MPTLVRRLCVICGANPEMTDLANEIHTGLPVCLDPIGCVCRFIQVVKGFEDERDSTSAVA